jgi:regulator of replication initiation timing
MNLLENILRWKDQHVAALAGLNNDIKAEVEKLEVENEKLKARLAINDATYDSLVATASLDRTELIMTRDKNRALCSRIENLTLQVKNLMAERDECHTEIDRLMHLLADPELLKVEVEKNAVNIELRPKDWALKLLVASIAGTIGDAPNYVVMGIGNDEFGHFEVTVKRYHGKSPTQVREEELAERNALISKLRAKIDKMDDPSRDDY